MSSSAFRNPQVPTVPELPVPTLPVLPLPPEIIELPVEYLALDGGYFEGGCVPTIEIDPETGKLVIRIGGAPAPSL